MDFNLNGTLIQVVKEESQYELTWFTWTEDTGSKTNYQYVYSDEELVQFLNTFV